MHPAGSAIGRAHENARAARPGETGPETGVYSGAWSGKTLINSWHFVGHFVDPVISRSFQIDKVNDKVKRQSGEVLTISISLSPCRSYGAWIFSQGATSINISLLTELAPGLPIMKYRAT